MLIKDINQNWKFPCQLSSMSSVRTILVYVVCCSQNRCLIYKKIVAEAVHNALSPTIIILHFVQPLLAKSFQCTGVINKSAQPTRRSVKTGVHELGEKRGTFRIG